MAERPYQAGQDRIDGAWFMRQVREALTIFFAPTVGAARGVYRVVADTWRASATERRNQD